MPKQRILLGMSGGIDSTIAIKKLQDAGYEVLGLTLNIILSNKNQISTTNKAINLASFFNIEHYVVDVSEHFHSEVIDYFTHEYLKGRTPCPCVKCNSLIKFKYLFEYANKYNCDKIATGHYVNLIEEDGIYYITKGADKEKEQSYFLWNISQDILAKCVFPLGNLYKKEVISASKSLNINHLLDSKESMSVCFLQGKDYRSFLDEQFPHLRQDLKNGEILNTKNEVIGRHDGYPYYTIGQKRALNLNEGISGQYVSRIDADSNRLICSPKQEIITDKIECKDYYFTNPDFLASSQNVLIRIRGFDYREPAHGNICKKEDAVEIRFKEPVWAITPGQPMVFYIGDRVVGGAVV